MVSHVLSAFVYSKSLGIVLRSESINLIWYSKGSACLSYFWEFILVLLYYSVVWDVWLLLTIFWDFFLA